MPTASDSQRDQMNEYFNNVGINDFEPYQFLKQNGWKDLAGMLIAPNREIEPKEWHCVNFLCDEWDYGYDPELKLKKENY